MGVGGYEKSLYLPLNFAVNLKLLFKKELLKKKNISMGLINTCNCDIKLVLFVKLVLNQFNIRTVKTFLFYFKTTFVNSTVILANYKVAQDTNNSSGEGRQTNMIMKIKCDKGNTRILCKKQKQNTVF